jgi:hypothetical protein
VDRVETPTRKGVSDLILVGCPSIFLEVKIADEIDDALDVSFHQRKFLREVEQSGSPGFVAAYLRKQRVWGLLDLSDLDRDWPRITLRGSRWPLSPIAGLVSSIIRISGSRFEMPLRNEIVTPA